MANVKFSRGTQAAYNALQTKDADTLYFIRDTHNIYLGDNLLFEADAFKDASISGKTITFTTHGAAGTTGTKTLSLSDFATTEEVSALISSVYKPKGNLAKAGIVAGLLVAGNEGNVYNVTEAFKVGSGAGEVPANLFVDGVAGNEYPAGTNIVVVNTAAAGATPVYKFDVLAGFIDLSGYQTKVTGATTGNIAVFDANGQVVDGGNAIGDFKTKQDAITPSSGTSTGSAGGQYVEQVTQNANGEITVTRKKLPNFTGSGTVGTESSAADAWKTVVHDAKLSSSRVLSGNTKQIPAATSGNDGYMTAGQALKLEGIDTGAETNVLEGVQVNGTDLTIDANKKVNINTETAYNASTNKIATMADVEGAVGEGLEWNELT